MTKEYLIIRADASTEIGTGHVMRCLALAQEWQKRGGRAIFVMAQGTPALEKRLRSEGIEVRHLSVQPGSNDDAAQAASLVKELGASWVVVDGYHFGAEYQRIIKDSGLRLLFIDDYRHADYYYADIVLNQNLYANEKLYKGKEPYTQLLLGSKYVLLRREFLKWREWKREIPKVARKVLVTMGGGDPNNMTLKVVQALKQVKVDGLEAVVVGGNNSHFKELQAAVQNSQTPICLESNVTDMPKLMAWADITVAAAGCTSWELMFMNLPGIVLVLAENQRSVAECLSAKKVAINLGWHEDVSPKKISRKLMELLENQDLRAKMAKKAQELVDGYGVARVAMQLKSEMIRLNLVRDKDCKLLWEWANDPEVRKVSFSSEPISWEKHVQWFQSKINNPNCVIFIATNNEGVPIGQIRYDIEGKEAKTSVNIDSKFRNKGYGSLLIYLSSQKLFDISDVVMIHAYIKHDNKVSTCAFIKAGFEETETLVAQGYRPVHLTLQKGNLT